MCLLRKNDNDIDYDTDIDNDIDNNNDKYRNMPSPHRFSQAVDASAAVGVGSDNGNHRLNRK